MDYVAEFRLFCSPERVWAICEYSEYMIGHRLLNQAQGNKPLVVEEVAQVPPEFVDQVLQAVKAMKRYCVVDVGLSSTGKWSVVECNPPFALSS